ncbi:hypothetical protein [Nonomuraea pusilla]|uniref:Uncharacterized protein n=1 Tax=Nonomuraea pusilla TaxID=46177 RepID=A0A1H8K4G9_9ACTN|nr:hypothetical protein [Nonomuraea pusilla]SEN87587.1 hypothetical protein SAMN05660976_08517 [Nonomuraea pusilla]
MPLPQPEDLADRIKALEQAVRDLKSSITNQSGLTSASQGWVLGNMGVPSVAPGTVQIGCNGGQFYAAEAGGVVKRMYPQMSKVTMVDFDLGNAPATYSSTYAQQQSVGIDRLYDAVVGILGALTGSGRMSTF